MPACGQAGYTTSRIFQGTSVSKTDYSNSNYTKAENEQFATLCGKAKAANLMVMTVSLDLDASNTAEKGQIDALKACSSESRFRKDTAGNPVKLYWNATGGNLADSLQGHRQRTLQPAHRRLIERRYPNEEARPHGGPFRFRECQFSEEQVTASRAA